MARVTRHNWLVTCCRTDIVMYVPYISAIPFIRALPILLGDYDKFGAENLLPWLLAAYYLFGRYSLRWWWSWVKLPCQPISNTPLWAGSSCKMTLTLTPELSIMYVVPIMFLIVTKWMAFIDNHQFWINQPHIRRRSWLWPRAQENPVAAVPTSSIRTKSGERKGSEV